jgi:hypothetical protein
MDDAIARYRAASQANDIDALMETLALDAELISPLSGRMVFRGHDDLRALLSAVYGSLKGWKWREELGDERQRVVIGEGKVGPFKLGDAMIYDLDERGQIKRVRPHLRPWLGLTGFALVAAPRLARHPGVLWRALRAGGRPRPGVSHPAPPRPH